MNNVLIKLKTIYDIEFLVQMANKYEDNLIIKDDNYIIDVNSILGICTLNLIKPVLIQHANNHQLNDNFLSNIRYLIVNN